MSEINQSLDRGLEVLEAIDLSSEPLGVRELSRRLGLGATIIQRALNTLLERGFIEQVDETRRYRIGYRSVSLGMSIRHGNTTARIAQHHLARLAEDHGLNGFLGTLRAGRAVYVLSVPSKHRLVVRLDAGETLPLHSTALGRILLAAVGEERSVELLEANPLEKFTDKTITESARIIGQLKGVRQSGFAVVDGENIAGVTSVGAPVRGANGKVIAGVSVAYMPNTVSLKQDDVTKLIVEAASTISESLGCPSTARNSWEMD